MSEMEYAFVGYFGILLLLLFFFPKSRFKKTEKVKEKETDDIKEVKDRHRLVEDIDYIREYGLIDLDRDEILHSDFFKILLKKVPKIEEDIESVKLFYDTVKRLQPYSMTDLFKLIKYLKEERSDDPTIVATYKTYVTASAIIYDFIIPESLFNDDPVVLSFVAAHMHLHSPVNVFDEVQEYIRNNQAGQDIVEQHKEVTELLKDLSFANIFLEMVFKHEAFLSIDYLYSRWLDQTAVKATNVRFYREDIRYFKKLVTMYFGIMEVDVPKSYLYIDTAVCEHVLQIRRYDPKKAVIKVVDSGERIE